MSIFHFRNSHTLCPALAPCVAALAAPLLLLPLVGRLTTAGTPGHAPGEDDGAMGDDRAPVPLPDPAFDAFAADRYTALRPAARRGARNTEDGDDDLQEAQIKMWRRWNGDLRTQESLDKLRPQSSVVVRHARIDRIRKARRLPASSAEALQEAHGWEPPATDALSDPAALVVNAALYHLLHRLIETRLTFEQRRCLHLRHFGEMTYDEIGRLVAEEEGWPETEKQWADRVKKRIYKAHAILRAALDDLPDEERRLLYSGD